MTAETPPNSLPPRSFSLSIGQLTFGSFMLVLAVIIITSTASVIAIRHIDSTFAELQRLQSVGDLAEDIDRRMNELRLAARDFVTDPGTQSVQVGEAAASLGEILKKTRLELAPEQQDMIDGVTERLAIVNIPVREGQISDIDREVLGAEGRLIQRVTELLRDVSERRGRVLARDFARTLAEAKWQSIVLGTAGVLIGLFASMLVVRRTVRPLASIANSIRAVAGGEKSAAIPATDVDNEIGDIARAAEVFRQTLVDADAAREAAVRALAEQRLAEESYRKLFESSVDGIYVTTPGGALLNANP